MAGEATEKTLDGISKQLSKKGEGWLEKISNQLDSKGATGNDPFSGFKVPKLTDIARGLTFGLAPGLIKKSVSGMQIFMDSLNSMQVDDVAKSGAIIRLVDDYSTAMTSFGEIPWLKALKGTFLIEKFSERFIKIGQILGSPENLKQLQPFRKFAKTFGEPLKLIGQSLSYFDKIQWVKMFFGTKIFEKLIFTFVKIGKLAYRNQDSLLTLGTIFELFSTPLGKFVTAFNNMKIVKTFIGVKVLEKIIAPLINVAKLVSKNKQTLERFGKTLNVFTEPLTKFVTAFNNIKFIKMFIGAKVLEKIITPLVNVAKAVSKNKQTFERFGKTLNVFTRPLSTFTTTFNNMKFVKMFIGVKVLEKIIGPLVNVAKAVSKNKQTFERFGETLLKITEPLKAFAEIFDKIGNALLKASVSLLIVAGSLGLAALSFQQFGNVDLSDMVKGIATLGIMMYSLKHLSKSSGDAIKGAASLAIVAASLGITAISLKLFSNGIVWSQVLGGIVALGVMAKGLQLLSKGGMEMIKGAAAVGIVAVSLGLAALSFKLFSGIDFGSVALGVITLGAIMGGLIAMGALLSGPQLGFVAIAAGIMALVGVAMLPFALGLKMLGDVNWKGFDGIFTALAKLSAGITLLTLAVPAMLLSAIAILPFALGMKILGSVNWKGFDGIFTALAKLAAGVALFILAVPAMTLAAASILPFALGMKILGSVNWKGFDGIFTALGTLAAGVSLFILAVPAMLLAAAAIVPFALGMTLLAGAMVPFAIGLKILDTINWKNFDGIFTALAKLSAGTSLLTLAIPAMLLAATVIVPFAIGMKILGSVNWDQITKSGTALMALAEGVSKLNFLKLAASGVAMLPFSYGIIALKLAIGKDDRLSSFLEKFSKGLKDLKGDSLFLAAKGIFALSGALVSFAGAQVVSGIGNLIGKILRFGGDSPIEQLVKLAKHGYNLSILGAGVAALAAGLKTLTKIDSELNILETLGDKFKGFDTLDPTGIKAFAEGLNMLVTALTALSQLDGKLNVLNDIPFDKLKTLSESIKPGAPLIQIVNDLQESNESKQTSQLLKQGIESKPPTVGAQLRESGSSMNSSTIIVNNNNGGNVTNNSSTSSNVNNNGSINAPIITASGSGMFTAE